MPLDQLWATWRSLYVTGTESQRRDLGELIPDDGRSLFERIYAADVAESETLIVHRGTHCFVLMNRFPYTGGHMMVLPNRAVPDLEDLTHDEFRELWDLVKVAVKALKLSFRCDAVNVGINLGEAAGGSQSNHIHVHVVPRWVGDANFMSVVGGSQVMPVALGDAWERLRGVWVEAGEVSHSTPSTGGTNSTADASPDTSTDSSPESNVE